MKQFIILILLSCFGNTSSKRAESKDAVDVSKFSSYEIVPFDSYNVTEDSVFIKEEALLTEYDLDLKFSKDGKEYSVNDKYLEVSELLRTIIANAIQKHILIKNNEVFIENFSKSNEDINIESEDENRSWLQAEEVPYEKGKRYRLPSGILGLRNLKNANGSRAELDEDYEAFLTIEKYRYSTSGYHYKLIFSVIGKENNGKRNVISFDESNISKDSIYIGSEDNIGRVVIEKLDLVFSNCIIKDYKEEDFDLFGQDLLEIKSSSIPEGDFELKDINLLKSNLEKIVLALVNDIAVWEEEFTLDNLGELPLDKSFFTKAIMKSIEGSFRVNIRSSDTTSLIRVVVVMQGENIFCYVTMKNCGLNNGLISKADKSIIYTSFSLREKQDEN